MKGRMHIACLREEVKDGTCHEHHLLLCSGFSKHLLAPGKIPGLKESSS